MITAYVLIQAQGGRSAEVHKALLVEGPGDRSAAP